MKKLNSYYDSFRDKLGDFVETQCDRLSHRQQAVIVIVFLTIFALSSLYIMVSSIYKAGTDKGEEIVIEHMRKLDLYVPGSTLKNQNNGREESN